MKTTYQRRPATLAESQKALAAVRKLWAPTLRECTEERMRLAKRLMGEAAQAVLDNRR